MSQFKPKKLNIDAIHAGQKYPEARTPFLPSDLNEIIEVIYGTSIGVENSAKRAFLLTKSNALIDISIKNKQVIFPNGTHIFGDDFLDNFSSIKYVPIPEDVMVLKEAIVVYNRVSKSISIFDHYYSGENYEYLYLFSFNFASEVLTDLPITHLVNGVKTEQGGVVNAHIPTKLVYSLGEDYINIDTSNHFITFPIDTTFGEHDVSDTDNETERTIYYTLVAKGKEELALVYDSGEEALKFVSNFDIVVNQSYEWLFTMYFDNGNFVYCDLEAPFYVDGKLGGDEPTVEIVQKTGESTTAVMSQKASTESFVPKVTTANSSFARLYGVNHSGGQYMENIGQNSPTSGSIVKRTGGGTIRTAAPKTGTDATNKEYVDDPNSKTKTIYWSNIQGGEYTVTNGEYCVGFCDETGNPTDINPISGGLRFIGSAGGYIDSVSIRGFGKTDCLDYYNEGENGIRIVFTESSLAGDYIVLNFRELPCPTGTVMLLIDVIY